MIIPYALAIECYALLVCTVIISVSVTVGRLLYGNVFARGGMMGGALIFPTFTHILYC